MTKEIHQQVLLPASPARVYLALMDQKQHAAFTGNKAKISQKVNGAVSCYGGYITATNLILKPGKLIVQAWRGANWPKEAYSIVTFRLSPAAGRRTRLAFSHVGVPSRAHQHITQGWHTHYWEPLRKFLKDL